MTATEKLIPLCTALEKYWGRKSTGLPGKLRERVQRAFHPVAWDDLNRQARRSLAAQADARNEPEYAQKWDAEAKLGKLRQKLRKHHMEADRLEHASENSTGLDSRANTDLAAEHRKAIVEVEATLKKAAKVAIAESGGLVDWREHARAIADEFFARDTEMTVRDTLASYSERVMEEMQRRSIHGPRGRIDNAKTIMRGALQGDQWWSKKKK